MRGVAFWYGGELAKEGAWGKRPNKSGMRDGVDTSRILQVVPLRPPPLYLSSRHCHLCYTNFPHSRIRAVLAIVYYQRRKSQLSHQTLAGFCVLALRYLTLGFSPTPSLLCPLTINLTGFHPSSTSGLNQRHTAFNSHCSLTTHSTPLFAKSPRNKTLTNTNCFPQVDFSSSYFHSGGYCVV